MILPGFLTRDPAGEIRLMGHCIGLYTLLREYLADKDADGIAENYPSLPLELVRQVLDFYRDNRAEVEEYVAAFRAELERQEREYVPGPGMVRIRALQERFQQANVERASDPTWIALSMGEKLQLLFGPDLRGGR